MAKTTKPEKRSLPKGYKFTIPDPYGDDDLEEEVREDWFWFQRSSLDKKDLDTLLRFIREEVEAGVWTPHPVYAFRLRSSVLENWHGKDHRRLLELCRIRASDMIASTDITGGPVDGLMFEINFPPVLEIPGKALLIYFDRVWHMGECSRYLTEPEKDDPPKKIAKKRART